MKKILATAIGLVAGATLSHAQGFLEISGNTADVTTNTSSYFAQGAGTTGKTYAGASTFDYAILVSTTQITDGPTDSGWTVLETSGDAAVVAGGSGLSGGEIIYNSGDQFASNLAVSPPDYFIEIVGWSASLGTSWTGLNGVESELADNFAGDTGYFGYEASSTADFATGAAVGDNVVGANGIPVGSLVLYNVAQVPEPATLALAGLGGLSMLFLRRRKS